MEENTNITDVQIVEESDLNEYALVKAETFLNKISDKLAQKVGRNIVKEFTSQKQENGTYCVTVLCYFTDDITKIVKQIEEKKKWRIVEYKNYVNSPRKNGYRGCYITIAIPVEDHKNETAVITIQIHTIGMEYWMEMEGQIEEGKIKKKDKLKSYSEHIIQMEEELLKLRKK